MKKQIKTLVILLVVAALLVAGVFGAKWITKKANEPEETEAKTVVFTVDTETVTEISWSFTGQEPLTLVKDDEGIWHLEDEQDTPLNTTKIQSILSSIREIPVAREFTDADPEAFGFTNPTNTVKITADGTVYEIVFGSKNSMETQYYMLYDGHTYMTDLFENNVFDKERTELYETPPETEGSGTYAVPESVD